MIMRTDTLEPLEKFRTKVWMDLNDNFPFRVNVDLTVDEYRDAKLWLKQRGIQFRLNTHSGYSRRSSNIGSGVMRFQTGQEALLFQLSKYGTGNTETPSRY